MIKALKWLLLGKWLGHPLHPAVVHVPIGFWLGGFALDVCSITGIGGNGLVRAAWWCIALGLASTLIVVPAGLAEWSEIKREKPAWTMALWHMILNVIVTLLLVASLALRGGSEYYERARVGSVAFLLMIVAIGGLMVSAYIGGRMVYDQGIGVARMSKGKWRKVAAASHANLPPQK